MCFWFDEQLKCRNNSTLGDIRRFGEMARTRGTDDEVALNDALENAHVRVRHLLDLPPNSKVRAKTVNSSVIGAPERIRGASGVRARSGPRVRAAYRSGMAPFFFTPKIHVTRRCIYATEPMCLVTFERETPSD